MQKSTITSDPCRAAMASAIFAVWSLVMVIKGLSPLSWFQISL